MEVNGKYLESLRQATALGTVLLCFGHVILARSRRRLELYAIIFRLILCIFPPAIIEVDPILLSSALFGRANIALANWFPTYKMPYNNSALPPNEEPLGTATLPCRVPHSVPVHDEMRRLTPAQWLESRRS